MKLDEVEIGKRVESIRKNKIVDIENKRDFLTIDDIANLLNISSDEYIRKIKAYETFKVAEISFIAKLYNIDINYILFGGVE